MNERIKTVADNQHANPAYFGLDFPELKKFHEEHEDLSAQYRQLAKETADLEQLAHEKKNALKRDRAEAMRKGKKETATAELKKLEDRVAENHEKLEDLKRAAMLVEKDLQAALEANRDAYLEQIREKYEGAEAQAEALREKMAWLEYDLAAAQRLTEYLTTPTYTGGLAWMGLRVPPPA